MKHKIFSPAVYILVVVAMFTATSCKKVLEQTPRNSTYDDVFWQNARDLRSAMAGNYSLMRNALTNKNNRYYMYGDAIAKNYYTIQYTGDGLEGIQNGDFTFQYNVESLGDWTLFYKSIAMSNIILKRVAAIPEANLSDVDDPAKFKNGILGQAYFLRALSYFMMVRVWGDVPVVTEAYEDPISAPQLPRSPRADVMKQIEDDCLAAAGLLDWGYDNRGDAAVTANKGSVNALLAHLYLWRATMTNVSSNTPIMADVDKAETAINSIINQGGYSLTDTARYYETFIGRSPEGIFELNMSENTLEGSASSIGMEFLRSSKIDYFGDNSRFYVATSYLNNHYKIKDGTEPHWFWDGTQWIWIDEYGPTIYDTTDVRLKKNFDDRYLERATCIKYSNVIYRNPGQKLNAYLSNNMIIFRLADMLLLKAEIALYRNQPDQAADIINASRVRNGAHVKDPSDPDDADLMVPHGLSKDDVMAEYAIERGKELYLEGHNFYDLLRTRQYGLLVDWLPEDRFKKEGFYWPVNPALFSMNPFLKQTTYWLGKI